MIGLEECVAGVVERDTFIHLELVVLERVIQRLRGTQWHAPVAGRRQRMSGGLCPASPVGNEDGGGKGRSRTDRNSSGKSVPLLIPRLLRTKAALVIRCLTLGLCRSVLSMISENASTNAVSNQARTDIRGRRIPPPPHGRHERGVDSSAVGHREQTPRAVPEVWNTPGFRAVYVAAKRSMIRSIFWASPGRRKADKNLLKSAPAEGSAAAHARRHEPRRPAPRRVVHARDRTAAPRQTACDQSFEGQRRTRAQPG